MQVDIFLVISSRAPGKQRKAKYRYILVCNGRSAEGSGELSDTTGHRLLLTCAIEALKRMTKPSMITIHTDCGYLINNRLQEWKESGWKRTDGKELKNEDLWQQFYDLQKPHAIRYRFECMEMYK